MRHTEEPAEYRQRIEPQKNRVPKKSATDSHKRDPLAQRRNTRTGSTQANSRAGREIRTRSGWAHPPAKPSSARNRHNGENQADPGPQRHCPSCCHGGNRHKRRERRHDNRQPCIFQSREKRNQRHYKKKYSDKPPQTILAARASYVCCVLCRRYINQPR